MAKGAVKKTSAKPLTKSEVLNALAAKTELSRKQVSAVLDALTEEIGKNVGKKGAGVFQIPGLVKIERKVVAARPAQKGWTNPFTKQVEDRPAKPATTKIKVRALKTLKDMAK